MAVANRWDGFDPDDRREAATQRPGQTAQQQTRGELISPTRCRPHLSHKKERLDQISPLGRYFQTLFSSSIVGQIPGPAVRSSKRRRPAREAASFRCSVMEHFDPCFHGI